MSSDPVWEPVDSDTGDLLTLLADDGSVVPSKADVPALFLSACRRDAMAHGGLVSVNRVRELLADEQIEHHQYSALWSAHTGRGKSMVKVTEAYAEVMHVDRWEVCKGSPSGNNGRPYPVRRWVG